MSYLIPRRSSSSYLQAHHGIQVSWSVSASSTQAVFRRTVATLWHRCLPVSSNVDKIFFVWWRRPSRQTVSVLVADASQTSVRWQSPTLGVDQFYTCFMLGLYLSSVPLVPLFPIKNFNDSGTGTIWTNSSTVRWRLEVPALVARMELRMDWLTASRFLQWSAVVSHPYSRRLSRNLSIAKVPYISSGTVRHELFTTGEVCLAQTLAGLKVAILFFKLFSCDW